MDMQTLIAAVRAHALANYNRNGWDNVVEAWGDGDIANVIGNSTSARGAIGKVSKVVNAQHAYAEDIRATAF